MFIIDWAMGATVALAIFFFYYITSLPAKD